MSGVARGVIGTAVAAALTLALVGLSRVPYTAVPSDDGALRLAWRYKSEHVDQCRRRTAEELERLPAHMRTELVCERRLRPYALRAALDDGDLLADTVRAGGARADRPLSLFRQVAVRPGRHRVRVSFEPIGPAADTALARRRLAVDTLLVFAPRQVVLVTLDEARGVLVVRTREPRPSE